MDKLKLSSKAEIEKAITHFGNEWESEIKQEATHFPCILVSSWCDDLEFGETMSFTTVSLKDFYEILN